MPDGMPPTISDRYWGQGFNSLFSGDAPVSSNPFQAPMRLKTDKPIDKNVIAQGLQNPHFNTFDPRTLKSSQPQVTRSGVQHYLNNPQELFNDKNQLGNQHPIVYTNPRGENVLLTGTHRGVVALLQGQPLKAIHIYDVKT